MAVNAATLEAGWVRATLDAQCLPGIGPSGIGRGFSAHRTREHHIENMGPLKSAHPAARNKPWRSVAAGAVGPATARFRSAARFQAGVCGITQSAASEQSPRRLRPRWRVVDPERRGEVDIELCTRHAGPSPASRSSRPPCTLFAVQRKVDASTPARRLKWWKRKRALRGSRAPRTPRTRSARLLAV